MYFVWYVTFCRNRLTIWHSNSELVQACVYYIRKKEKEEQVADIEMKRFMNASFKGYRGCSHNLLATSASRTFTHDEIHGSGVDHS